MVLTSLQQQALEHLHRNHEGQKRNICLFVSPYTGQISMKILKKVLNYSTCPEFLQMIPKDKSIAQKIPSKLLKTIVADIFMLNKKITYTWYITTANSQ